MTSCSSSGKNTKCTNDTRRDNHDETSKTCDDALKLPLTFNHCLNHRVKTTHATDTMHYPGLLVGFAALAATSFGSEARKNAAQPILFAATHTRDDGWMVGTGKGVYTFKFDTSEGSLTPFGVTSVGVNPVYVQDSTKQFSGGKPVLYAATAVTDESKVYPGTQTGYVSALTLRLDGTLELLNTMESHGGNPTHISLGPNDDFIVVSNYDGSLSMFSLNEDGSLTNETFHQEFPTGSKAYELDTAKRTLETLQTVYRPAGSGPRHMAVHPSGGIAYVVDEIANTVGVYKIDTETKLLSSTAAQNITTLPSDFTNASTAADIHLTANGKFLYASNRGHNSIAMFAVHEADGTLTSLDWENSRGKTPKSFAIYEDWLIGPTKTRTACT
ncbi:unnamed protein product [Phytophthora lilii]|uniref:Unnamed protein product n=1 Tax=Phytophthora lilii TaxID=2077276 RepID=A0A9W6U0N9_9STRA|nr:unnamed protein product [Phytophthora lilii]